jgi:hypothetical protein
MSGRALRCLWLLSSLCCGTAVRAGAETPAVATPPAATPAPVAIPAAGAARAPEGRHQLGLQVGGSGVVQVAYRLRVVGPLHLDVGALGLPHSPFHATIGVLAAIPVSDRWRPYLGIGAGHAGLLGRSYPAGCMPDAPGCEATETFDYINYFSGRVGVGYALGADRRHTLGIDIGAWYGWRGESREAPDGSTSRTSRRFVWPMGGVSYFIRI